MQELTPAPVKPLTGPGSGNKGGARPNSGRPRGVVASIKSQELINAFEERVGKPFSVFLVDLLLDLQLDFKKGEGKKEYIDFVKFFAKHTVSMPQQEVVLTDDREVKTMTTQEIEAKAKLLFAPPGSGKLIQPMQEKLAA